MKSITFKDRFLQFFNINKIMEPISLIMIFTITLGTVLRLYRLDFQSLWLDEIYAVNVARNTPWEVAPNYNGNLLEFLRHWDIGTPPLYYWVLSTFEVISDSDFMVRIPSAIFGILTIPLLYKTGCTLFGKREGVIASALLAFSSFNIWFSQMARSYAMFTFLSLLIFYFYMQIMKDRQKKNNRYWLGFVVASVLGAYTHYYTFLILGLLFVYWAIITIHARIYSKNFDKHIFVRFLLFFGFTIVVTLPSAINFLYGYGEVGGRYEEGFFSNFYDINRFTSNVIGPFTVSYGVDTSSFFFITVAAVFVFAISLIFFFLHIKKYKSKALLLLLVTLPPFLFIYATLYNPRYALFLQPFYLLIVSKGMVEIVDWEFWNEVAWLTSFKRWLSSSIKLKGVEGAKRFKPGIGIPLLLLIILIPNLIVVNQYYTIRLKEDWESAGKYLEENIIDGDIVLISPGFTKQCIRRYLDYPGVEIRSVSNISQVNITLVSGRIWFVDNRYTQESIRDVVKNNYSLMREYKSIRIYLKE